jgi:hypothetical protein
VCVAQNFPAIKWFSSSDQSGDFPTPIRCYRVDKQVNGFSYSDWASWYKLLKFVDGFPFV